MLRGLVASGVALVLIGASPASAADLEKIEVVNDDRGSMLLVDEAPYFVRGMNWGYVPIGTNYSYNFWGESETFIRDVLDREMRLLRDMGVNVIRQYPGIPPEWVTYIHETYGIHTMINPLMGRYGVMVDGRFVPNVDYGDPRTREAIKSETMAVVEKYREVPGVLMWLLGNENNYGLVWTSFEIEDLPPEAENEARARHLYSLVGELVDAIHAVDTRHPVSFANGDVQYIHLMAELAPGLDVFGTNVYRGRSGRDVYEIVHDKMGIPVMYSEFGADAYDAKRKREDHLTQAGYIRDQWQDVYEQSYDKGRVGNAIGGFTFQWSDGWWKFKQEENLDVHDTNASWSNQAYLEDWAEGLDNMNEEWFGITAKGYPDPQGHYDLYPRTAYYVLQDAYRLDPYAEDTDLERIREHFGRIDPKSHRVKYETRLLSRDVAALRRAAVADVRVQLSTFVTDDDTRRDAGARRPVFDHLQSFYLGVGFQPVDNFTGNLSLNMLGNVAANPIDQIFYEARGRVLTDDNTDEIDLTILERIKVYQAGFTWEHPWFTLEGYYRTPHFHWGYEGDFFGLYREANYGPAMAVHNYGSPIDMYNADAPLGVAFVGKKGLKGLRIAIGPQLFWGANPAIMAMYTRSVGPWTFSAMHQEDIAPQGQTTTSNAVPEQVTRKSTVYASYKKAKVQWDVGGIIAGTDRLGRTYRYQREAEEGERSLGDSGYHLLEDRIRFVDTLGAKSQLRLSAGPVNWFTEGSYQGLVADGGWDQRQLYSRWQARGSGRGNHWHVQSGLSIQAGNVAIAPNLLYQRPLVGPIVPFSDSVDPTTGGYTPTMRARNVIDTPFAVLENRETLAAELILAFDPTPGTWMWAWDNDQREDAVFAGSLGFVYRVQPTTTDGQFGFLADGTLFAFGAAPPAQNVWDVSARLVFNPGRGVKMIANLYAGQAQSTGDDPRLVTRGGGDLRLWWRSLRAQGFVKFHDWGPYDFHRTFNLTFPVQSMVDFSVGLGRPKPGVPNTRLGTHVKYRTLNQYSPDFVVDPLDPNALGWEYEWRTYIEVSL